MKENFEGTQVPALMQDLIQKIKDHIAKNEDLTNAKVALSLGMTPQSFSDVLNGHRGSLNQLIRIVNGLGYEVEFKVKKSKNQ